jgi:hypothetical protein
MGTPIYGNPQKKGKNMGKHGWDHWIIYGRKMKRVRCGKGWNVWDLRENHLGSVWTIFFGKKNPHFMDLNGTSSFTRNDF